MNSQIIYHVSFPKLNIFLQISPIALHFKNIYIYWYGILLALGFLLGYLYVNKKAVKLGLGSSELSDFVIISSFTGIIFARVYYVLFYPGDFYKEHPEKIFMISEGGIAIYGAIIGGFLAVWIMSKIKKKKFLFMLDLMSPGIAIGQTIGRWGNFVNQEAFGSVTSLPWGMSSENTSFLIVHPCFLYESLGCFVIFLTLHFCGSSKIKKSGNIFFLYTALYGILRAFIEPLRTDSLLIPQTQIRVSQLFAILLSIFSIICIVLLNSKIKIRLSK